MLLSQHGRHHFRGRQRRFGAYAGRQGGTGRHARGGRAEGIHPAGLCQQAGPEGRDERPANQRRLGTAGDPKPTVVHPGNLGAEGKGLVRGIRLAGHVHKGHGRIDTENEPTNERMRMRMCAFTKKTKNIIYTGKFVVVVGGGGEDDDNWM